MVRSDDGSVEYRLTATPDGVFVGRVQQAGEARVVQSMLFADEPSFQRWCHADSARFTHPLVHAALRRNGAMMFDVARSYAAG